MRMSTIHAIDAELGRARAGFPMPNPTFTALVEEVGELAQALLKCRPGDASLSARVYDEAMQIAVMAIRVMEEGDSVFPAYDTNLVQT
jgi:NTP pyrophosphatase (non-canonical NTP hydrolase)